MKTPRKIHYAWYILACCILINIIVQALVMTCSSLYIVPMYNDLQVPRALLSLQSVMITVGAVLTAPVWGKLYKTQNARMLLPIAVGAVAVCTFARSLMPNIWFILPLSLVKGIFFTGATLLPISVLLTAWFKERRGFAVSVASIGTSVGSILFSPFTDRMIQNFGWRGADRISGLIMFIIMVPCLIIIIRNRPKDIGLLPLGATAEDVAAMKRAATNAPQKTATGMSLAEARRSPILWVFLLGIFGMTVATGAALQIPVYLQDIGYSSTLAAGAVSAYSAVAIAGKLILGQVTDKKGAKFGTVYVCSICLAAFLCFILAKNPVALAGMVVFYGLGCGITAVMPTLLTSKIFGNRDYGPIYGLVVSINRFGGVVGNVLVALLFDLTGSYSIIWPVCAAAMLLTLLSLLYCLKSSQKFFVETPNSSL